MLAIRMQRTGRKGHAQFRIIVQEARLSPKSGRVVFNLGNYDPHAKTVSINKEKATFYLEHGAQPSSRVALLLKNEGVKLPKWVSIDTSKKSEIKNAEKLRRNRPAEPAEEANTEEPAGENAAQQPEDNEEAVEAASESAAKAETVEEAKAE